MSTMKPRTVTLFVAMSLLMAMPFVTAGSRDLTGTGPDSAMTPSNEWVQIQPGEYHWYAFKYTNDAKAEDRSPIEVIFTTAPNEGAVLTLRNQAQADLWRTQGKHEHFGCCTTVADKDARDGKGTYAVWSSRMNASGTYYMVVEHSKPLKEPVAYRIAISGEGISFPAGAPKPIEAAAVSEVAAAVNVVAAAPAPPVESKVVAPMVGSTPDDAAPLPSEWMTVQPGETQWFFFDYTRDRKASPDDVTPVELTLWTDPKGLAFVTLRDAEDATLWTRDGKQQWFGSLTPANLGEDVKKPDYASWKGALLSTGRYYVVVQHAPNSSVPARYRIEVSGLQ